MDDFTQAQDSSDGKMEFHLANRSLFIAELASGDQFTLTARQAYDLLIYLDQHRGLLYLAAKQEAAAEEEKQE